MTPGSAYLTVARGLTLARMATTPLFLVLLVRVAGEPSWAWSVSLLLLYAFIALSDLLDGRLARKAGAPTAFWGRMDAVADILFTTLGLAAAAWLGRVGPWVPAGVAVLAGRFIVRNLRVPPRSESRPREDRAGKAAGVIYYLLVGVVALEVSVGGGSGRWWVARGGDAVFAYTLFVLLWRPTPGSPGRSPRNRSR